MTNLFVKFELKSTDEPRIIEFDSQEDMLSVVADFNKYIELYDKARPGEKIPEMKFELESGSDIFLHDIERIEVEG